MKNKYTKNTGRYGMHTVKNACNGIRLWKNLPQQLRGIITQYVNKIKAHLLFNLVF